MDESNAVRLTFAASIAIILSVVLAIDTGTAQSPPQPPGAEAFQEALAGPADDSPEPEPTQGEIAAAEDAYTDISDSAALRVAREEFLELLRAELIPELELPADQHVEDYLDANTALVTEDGWQPNPELEGPNPTMLVESTLPLRAPEAGDAEPLEADLVAQGDHYEAENPIVTAELSADLEQGVELPAVDVAVAPAGVEETDPETVADKLFYPNAEVDTDYLIAPTATGAEIFAQLRPPEAPESLPLEVEMPAGATLEETPQGGGLIRDAAGKPIVSISPALATDAAGRDVPAELAFSGDRITIEVPRSPAEDYLYPIMVDPVIDQYNWGVGQQSLDRRLWWWTTSNGNDFNPVEDTSAGAGGLRTNARAGRSYLNGSYGEWVANSIRDSYIERIDFFNFDRSPTSPGACTLLGIWMPDQYQWAPVTVEDTTTGYRTTGSYANLCNNRTHDSRRVWVGNSPTPDGPGGDAEPWDRSMGIFALSSSGGYRSTQASNLLRSAHIYRYDRNNATITSMPTSAWTSRPTLGVRDVGLGAAHAWVWQGWNVVASGSQGCTGAHQQECPIDAQIPIDNVPEGRHDYTVSALDPLLQGTSQAWTAQIDRSPPSVTIGGSLVTSQGDIRGDQSYQLTLRAEDGSRASAEQMRSGVQKLEVFVDSESEPRFTATQSCAHPDGSCPMDATWQVPPGEFTSGQHSIRVVPTDAVGNTSMAAQAFSITAQGDEDEPQVSMSTTPGVGGSTILQVTATDPGPIASGVSHLEVYVGSELVSQVDSPCPTGGCSISRSLVLSPSQSPDVAQIDAIADDQAGITNHARVGVTDEAFDRFGYNTQDIGLNLNVSNPEYRRATVIRLAQRTGAELFRFPINWCFIANSEGSDPASWRWGIYDSQFFDYFKRLNTTGGPEDDIRVLPVLAGSPGWARGGGDCSTVAPPNGQKANDQAWRDFVEGVVQRWGPSRPEYGMVGIEAWNEPNNPDQWGGGELKDFVPQPHRFAELVNMASNKVETIAPSLKVLPGGLQPRLSTGPGEPTNSELVRFARLATQPNTDNKAIIDADPERIAAVSVHLFANRESDIDKVRERIITRQYDELWQNLPPALANRPRWITEIGFPSAASQETIGNPKRQRERLADLYVRFAQRDAVSTFLVHTLIDGPGVPSDTNGRFGVFEANCTPRPAAYKLAELTGTTLGAQESC